VICLDDLSTGTARNIDHLRRHDRFTFVRADVRLPIEAPVDEIYNLACPASPPDYQTDSVGTTKTCVFGALNVLELALGRGVPVFQASTSEVYGDPLVHPQAESYLGNVNPIGPRACYDEGKRCAETLFFDYARHKGVQIRVARIFNTYGPRMRPDDGRVVSNFVVQALLGRDITIYGNGSQTRSFCYVDDLIEGILRLMCAPGHAVGPVNLGNPGEFTVRSLADMVIELTGSRSKIVHMPLPADDPRQRRPDISKAAELLEWKPTVELTRGLEKTIAYFDAFLRAGARRKQRRVA
jgi:UDP-glucuronate decarboxylase